MLAGDGGLLLSSIVARAAGDVVSFKDSSAVEVDVEDEADLDGFPGVPAGDGEGFLLFRMVVVGVWLALNGPGLLLPHESPPHGRRGGTMGKVWVAHRLCAEESFLIKHSISK